MTMSQVGKVESLVRTTEVVQEGQPVQPTNPVQPTDPTQPSDPGQSQEVWATYYNVLGTGTLTFASSKDIKWSGHETDEVDSWNITDGFSSEEDVPWLDVEIYENSQGTQVAIHGENDYSDFIENAIILDNVFPEKTDYMFYDLNMLSRIEGLDNLIKNITSIGKSTFENCVELTSIDLSNGTQITSIEESAFESADLRSISFPDSIITIGENAFAENPLDTITLPSNLEEIGDYAFIYCNFSSITIPESVTFIGESAFEDCDNLTSINIPKNVQKLGAGCFYLCENLTTVYYDAIDISESNFIGDFTDYEEDEVIFAACNITTLVIGDEVQIIPSGLFVYCDALTSVEIPNSVTQIGNKAFYGCDHLENIIIHNTYGRVSGVIPWGAENASVSFVGS